MPNWHNILHEISRAGSTHDIIRRKYLKKLQKVTMRNVIIYYSGWLQKPDAPNIHVNDADKNGFMTVIHGLNRSKGLDLLLHTPGGETSAMESIVDYLHSMFGTNIRAIIPQLAMSAGTMIACACKEIIMGKQSSLGPIDPQFRGIPAHGVVEEFKRAYLEICSDPKKAAVWQPIIAKYTPTLIGECEKAIDWSNEMVKEWLLSGMLATKKDAENLIENIIEELGNLALLKSHARHLSVEKCKEIGLNIIPLEDDPKLQEAVLSVHHACIHTLGATNAIKIIENHNGIAFIQSVQQIVVKR
ncbi:S49 family peptidase [candidate division WOR-3 bacterium]|nr:S49 family peptidase [candidate division WOR-3 bacterium]MCK4329210.1 S49 family peptidase [candidate division WOR-3 bacterium]